MRNSLLTVITMLLVSISSNSQAEVGVGMAAGVLSGYGYSYRTISEEDFAFQITGIFSQKKTNERTNGNLGLMLYRDLKSTENSSFYWLVGVRGSYKRFRSYDDNGWNPITRMYDSKLKSEYKFYFGAGLGAMFRIFENSNLSVELPLVASEQSVLPLPQVGLHYILK